MTDEKGTPLSTLGEFGLIERLTASFENVNESTIKGIGDDSALLAQGLPSTPIGSARQGIAHAISPLPVTGLLLTAAGGAMTPSQPVAAFGQWLPPLFPGARFGDPCQSRPP